MTSSLKPRLFLVWSIVAVPSLFSLFLLLSYRYALSHGELPFLAGREWRWYGAFVLALVSGVICTFLSSSGRMLGRSLLAASYLLIMSFILFLIGLFVACSQGDCV